MILKGTEALHGDIPQGLREKILSGFRTGRIPVLIATDVAARGLDIDHIDLVVHYGVPRVRFLCMPGHVTYAAVYTLVVWH